MAAFNRADSPYPRGYISGIVLNMTKESTLATDAAARRAGVKRPHRGADGRGVGLIALADAPRETSARSVAALHELGVEVVMLGGDNAVTAKAIAAQLGTTRYL